MEEKLPARDRIFQAALARIKHYGLGKTTMAEIAGDCGMSPGNIYRFFQAKIDIAEAIFRKYLSEEHTRLSAVARRSDIPADRRLREVLRARLRLRHEATSGEPKMAEVGEVLRAERPGIAKEEAAHERAFFSQILRDGMDAGLFKIDDPDQMAGLIQTMTLRFAHGEFLREAPLAELEREFEAMMDLILKGLAAPALAARAPRENYK